MDLQIDVPVEVTKQQYLNAMSKCPGLVCGRIDEANNKYYIKPWFELKFVAMVLEASK